MEHCLCGGTVEVTVRYVPAHGVDERHWHCKCLKCGLRGPEVHPYEGDVAEAVRSWYGCMNAVLENVRTNDGERAEENV